MGDRSVTHLLFTQFLVKFVLDNIVRLFYNANIELVFYSSGSSPLLSGR
jgi:hypothetical protein